MSLQPRYVVNQVTAGDYDCPRKVLKFLTDLHAAFRMLNLRNDFLRKKFDGRPSYQNLFPFIILISMQNFQVCYYFEWGPLVLIFPHLSPVAGMKYDLRRVEEVYYDVKIRGLAVTGDAIGERGIEGQS